MNDPVARGSCRCGAVRFRARLPSKWVAHCHCSDCRRSHGAAFVTWAGFASSQVSVDADAAAPSWYASSPGARRGFCARCGSPMFFESERWPGETHVARALFVDELDREPGAHVFYESHVPWLTLGDQLPRKSSTASASLPPAGSAGAAEAAVPASIAPTVSAPTTGAAPPPAEAS